MTTAVVALIFVGAAADVPLDVSRTNDLNLTVDGNELAVETTGSDPFIEFRPAAFLRGQSVLSFEAFAPDGVTGLSIYYGPPITSERQFSAGNLPQSETWRAHAVNLASGSGGAWSPVLNRLRLDLGGNPGVRLRLRNFRVRKPTDEERRSAAAEEAIRSAKQVEADRIAAYVGREFPSSVASVHVFMDGVRVRGDAHEGGKLFAIPPHAATGSSEDAVPVAELVTGPFDVMLPRDDLSLVTRFAVVDGEGDLLSHASHVTAIDAGYELPELKPRSIKGLGGLSHRGPPDDFVELGIDAVTINVRLDQLVTEDGSPNEQVLRGHDELIRWATDRGMVVSAILLVPQAKSSREGDLIHPESDGAGVYAMPDMTTPHGLAAYSAAVQVLVDRYCRHDDPHGRIANWIIHNEVDRYRSWTDMGLQPRRKLTETYVRSMRLVHNLARARDPHARVFASLTHHWNLPDDERWRWFGSRQILEDIASLTRAEGDFAWGVAYHPYPQSLFRPTPWSDPLPKDDFDTRMITTKNIDVLCRWMRTPAMRTASGEVRGVLLSEQGFHTADASEASQQTQAAAFLYTWDRLRQCDCIETFHNHRWIDAPGEGGLNLGLRTRPEPGHPIGRKKLAWDLYRDLGTPAEANWRWLEKEWQNEAPSK